MENLNSVDTNLLLNQKRFGFDEIKLQKREKLIEQGEMLYPYGFEITHKIGEVIQEFIHLERRQMPFNSSVTVAGRIWSARDMGKTKFFNLKDETAKIQLYCSKDSFSDKAWQNFSALDIGDIVGLTGTVFRTKTGELTIKVSLFQILTKTVVNIPVGKETNGKVFNRLNDVETIYREPYLNWLLNDDARNKIIKRFQIITEIRNWMNEAGFLEVTTPAIELIYGGAEARPFKTTIWALDNQEAFLRISPELYLKRYIVAGFPKVYTICQNFRNEGIDYSHNPEFCMMEWYCAFSDYEFEMNRFEMLVSYLCEKICGDTKIIFQGKELDFAPPWRRLTMLEALNEFGNIDASNASVEMLKEEMRNRDIEFPENITWGIAVAELFESICEQHLIQPTFIIDFPYEISPLTKSKRGDDRLVERFEPFIAKMELGNAYSELNDPVLQLQKFIQQKEIQSKRPDKEKSKDYLNNPIDADFIKAIGCGMPPTGGVGIGIDRLIMILTNSASIRDIIPFPMVKPI